VGPGATDDTGTRGVCIPVVVLHPSPAPDIRACFTSNRTEGRFQRLGIDRLIELRGATMAKLDHRWRPARTSSLSM